MNNNNTELKELPNNTKFTRFNSDNEDIILGEYLIALLINNGASFNELLESANEIEDKKERILVKKIMTDIIQNFINLNPEFAEILQQNDKAQTFT
ncbi:hypothetical protein K5V07_14105 [Flavobacterium sp. CHNK8]|uniref:hypothetical protein n=1 Tax=Flavobacterium sp. CHNK8 TaxID=2871165 RepID=UPI001C8E3156|nr:hypothetical protein [Flavobacterium sp. CHNK8]QZK91572.1 hypothetical protein K5V07_14105 [Flavobacterium sp. CHNK8]